MDELTEDRIREIIKEEIDKTIQEIFEKFIDQMRLSPDKSL